MKHCRQCKSKYPEYVIPQELMRAIEHHAASDVCPACLDLAAKKSGIILTWSVSFCSAAATSNHVQQDKPTKSVHTIPDDHKQHTDSSWQRCQYCGTDTLFKGKCINPKHDSLYLS
jgi:hypothetical protein